MNLSIIGGSSHMERRLNQSPKSSFTLNTSLNPNAAEFVPSSLRPNPVNPNPVNPNPVNSNPVNGNPIINIPEFIPASLRSPPTENGTTGFGNPNAPEFIPSFLRSNPGNRNPIPEFIPASLRSPTSNPGNQIPNFQTRKEETLNRSDSNLSSKSDDELRQYWRVQLPDDLTPDFKPSQEDEILEPPVLSPINSNRSMWGKSFSNNGRDVNSFNGESSGSEVPAGGGFGTGEDLNPMKFLSMKFPNVNTQGLADVYLKSERDLSLTLEILSEMESQNRKPKSFVSPNLLTLDSPSSPSNLFRTLSTPARRISDSDLLNEININNNGNNNNQWRFNNNNNNNNNNRIGSGRFFRNLSGVNGSFNGGDDVATWLETGESIGNLHLESKEEVRNLALLRNVCLEQARQAYLSGNDSLSKELTLKGQLYNMQIKAAQEKAKEALSQHNRSLLLSETEDRPIDLRGLHASEAIHVLNYELTNRKRTVRSTGRRLETSILLGTSRGLGVRTPAHVEQYLFEHGFRCSMTQPGVLRVVLY
ncbi:hypothetical protein LUZ60_005661 [Juncus effusus]|nr:hypothetical protein LUZ60_005661 [Juncus effusus]